MIYDLILSLGVLAYLPKLIWNRKLHLGFDIPQAKGIIWIHAVSVGEVKSAKGLIRKIRADYPDTFILVTTITATGQEEAKRSLPEANAYRYLPLDFRLIMRRWIRALKPKALIIVESDFWYNLLREAKAHNVPTALVSGKLSPRSAKRFLALRPLAKRLFRLFDLILVQNQEHLQRFAPFSNPHLGGNLKLDATPIPVAPTSSIPPQSLLISCTHAPEESDLLDALATTPGTIYLAPRHPHRYSEVARLLTAKNISYSLWSHLGSNLVSNPQPTRVVLIDSMGLLPIFYTHCELTIVGGSFTSNIGGHNFLEPCLYSCPVFFGPSIHQQTELAHLVLAANAGRQVTLAALAPAIADHRLDPASLRAGALLATIQSRGALDRTYSQLCEKILRNK